VALCDLLLRRSGFSFTLSASCQQLASISARRLACCKRCAPALPALVNIGKPPFELRRCRFRRASAGLPDRHQTWGGKVGPGENIQGFRRFSPPTLAWSSRFFRGRGSSNLVKLSFDGILRSNRGAARVRYQSKPTVEALRWSSMEPRQAPGWPAFHGLGRGSSDIVATGKLISGRARRAASARAFSSA